MIETNADEIVIQFRNFTNATLDNMSRDMHKAGLYCQARIQANASGRPGPNAVTGDYRRSWTTTRPALTGPKQLEVQVATNKPQGMRLEFGFSGPDSLGRVYRQPPFPHVQPAVQETEAEMPNLFRDIFPKVT